MNENASFPDYKLLSRRKESFRHRSTIDERASSSLFRGRISPICLAWAGFFYSGYGDTTICFQCGIAIANWANLHDFASDPISEHVFWNKKCPYACSLLALSDRRNGYDKRNIRNVQMNTTATTTTRSANECRGGTLRVESSMDTNVDFIALSRDLDKCRNTQRQFVRDILETFSVFFKYATRAMRETSKRVSRCDKLYDKLRILSFATSFDDETTDLWNDIVVEFLNDDEIHEQNHRAIRVGFASPSGSGGGGISTNEPCDDGDESSNDRSVSSINCDRCCDMLISLISRRENVFSSSSSAATQ